MKKHIFIVTRYSILSRSRNYSWNIPLDVNNQKEIVFSPVRLDLHEHLFLNLTLPSIRNQSQLQQNADGFTYIVCVSEELPEGRMTRLEDALRDMPYVKIEKMPVVDDVSDAIENVVQRELQQFDSPVIYATARLDDDDALSGSYLEAVNAYLKSEYAEFALSFARGYEVLYDETRQGFRRISEFYSPKNALGLCYIKAFDPRAVLTGPYSVHGLRTHHLVDRIVPCVLDARDSMVLRTRHKGSITAMKREFDRKPSMVDRARGLAKSFRDSERMSRQTKKLIESGCVEEIADKFGLSTEMFILGK